MRWQNVRTIFAREVRDQLRDRRTLFMILGLPILLYPIIGMGTAALATAFGQKIRVVVVVGAESLPDTPPLLNKTRDGFNPDLFDPPTPEEASRIRVVSQAATSEWSNPKRRESAIRDGEADVVVIVPPDVKTQISGTGEAPLSVVYNSVDDHGKTCAAEVREVIAAWREVIVQGRLKRDGKPSSYVDPVRIERQDVATRQEVGGNIWAKIFPFLIVVMALTGAFYPAIDLCAGEKERGTMETLLISPASRVEIVLGKFFTVMLASVATALLNLASMSLTGWQLVSRFPGLEPAGPTGKRLDSVLAAPSLGSLVWILLLLIPLSAFFSALCLALAVLARSMKEGQYYMTPLYLMALPLMFASLAPGIELDLFTSLVPITGVSLLLRTLMQGRYAVAAQFSLPVLLPTIVYGILALRWAVQQFQKESVLFREAERFSLDDWLRHLIRDRESRPNEGMAILAFALMLGSAWFLSAKMGTSLSGVVLSQAAFILAPPVILALLFTRDPLGTLRLNRLRPLDLLIGAGLALAVNPLVNELSPIIQGAFPIPKAVQDQLAKILHLDVSLGTAVLGFAIIPAICEEVAFRGFVLSGLRKGQGLWPSIVFSAFLFGFLHILMSVFQQFFNAALLGLILGLLALKTGSLWPCITFHAINNGLAVVAGTLAEKGEMGDLGRMIYRDPAKLLYQPAWILLGGAVATALIVGLILRPEAEEAG